MTVRFGRLSAAAAAVALAATFSLAGAEAFPAPTRAGAVAEATEVGFKHGHRAFRGHRGHGFRARRHAPRVHGHRRGGPYGYRGYPAYRAYPGLGYAPYPPHAHGRRGPAIIVTPGLVFPPFVGGGVVIIK